MKVKSFVVTILFVTAALFIPVVSATKDDKEAALARQAKITMAEARKTALARIPGNIEMGKLEREKGKLWFEFEIHKTGSGAEAEIHVDAITGEVGDIEEEGGKASAKENEMFNAAKVSWDDAENAALNRVSGAVVKARLERERGKVLYEFEIAASDGKQTPVHVDAVTGEVESVGKK
jgi:uncharacterized membrane protein YkoI